MADIGDQRYKTYQSFCSAFRDYHRLLGKRPADVEKALSTRWEALKADKAVDLTVVAEETRKLKDAATAYRSRSTLTHFFSKAAACAVPATSEAPQSSTSVPSDDDEVLQAEEPTSPEPSVKRPKQEQLEREIADIAVDIQAGVKKSQNHETKQRLRELRALKEAKVEKLKRLKVVVKAVQKHREKKRESGPEVRERGRPSLEQQGHKVKEAIIDYFENRGAADNCRRSARIEGCLTLEKLRDVLLDEYGLDLKRSTLYTRILPRNSITAEGKRHHDCAPDLASLFGPEAVFFLSQDDKARVPIGLPAANKQVRVAMHLQYRVSLPDHDWVLAADTVRANF